MTGGGARARAVASDIGGRVGSGRSATEALGLTEDQVAFYDALEVNDRAGKVLGDETLRLVAQDLVSAVKGSVTIDRTVRENVRAPMPVIIKRIVPEARLSAG